MPFTAYDQAVAYLRRERFVWYPGYGHWQKSGPYGSIIKAWVKKIGQRVRVRHERSNFSSGRGSGVRRWVTMFDSRGAI